MSPERQALLVEQQAEVLIPKYNDETDTSTKKRYARIIVLFVLDNLIENET